MQYIWIFLPILGYIAILILSFFRYRNLVLTEAKLFVWYLALGLLAAVYAYDRHTSEMFNDFLIDGRRP
ncbi:MAG TPA: hypothetical protein VEF04_05360, partial [Blastocatellia bacterium]|nr:hypothetical protein [Blastocatellia bacterium]